MIERLYAFLFSSNHRGKVLSLHVKVMMKRLVTTRYKTIRAVKTGFQGVIQSLDLLTSASENLLTKGGTQIVLLSIENFSFMSRLFY